jgi:Carboxypeptidase regulatory-like domain
MRVHRILLIAAVLGTVGCHPGPVLHSDPNMDVGGTIAGIVSTTSKDAVPARKVTAIDTVKGSRYEATTGANGGYTIKVPRGTYRLELQLLEGERVTTQPADTKIDNSDLDPQRNFVITGGK